MNRGTDIVLPVRIIGFGFGGSSGETHTPGLPQDLNHKKKKMYQAFGKK